MARTIIASLSCLALFACVSSGARMGTELGEPDAGRNVLLDGGARDAGSSPTRDGGNADVGGSTVADGGGGVADGGSGATADGGASVMDADVGNGGCTGDLAGPWSGTFTGEVWWTSNPTTTEPVSGTLEFTLACAGQKYGVMGTMTGSEAHAVRFTAMIVGEVNRATPPVMQSRMSGEVIFTALAGVRVPFTGTMTGALSGARVPNGSWQGQSTQPLVPAAGDGTWQAARR